MHSVEKAIQTLKAQKPIIIVDDEDRENEGDLIYPADLIDDKAIAFMLKHCSGIICLTLPAERLDELQIPLMVSETENTSKLGTSFTVSIEAAEGTSTGVSAADRAKTIQTAIHPDTKPNDLAKPGHVFPLRAHPGGLAERQGHTEASITAVSLAGFSPAAVLCELMNSDGTMAKGDQITTFAQENGLSIISTAALHQYMLEQQKHG